MTTKAKPASSTLTGNGNGVGGRNGVSKGKYSTKRPRTQPRPNELKAHALRYAMNGWRVLPLLPGGKNPRIPSAHGENDPLRGKCKGECGKPGHGVHDATDDLETIAAWWDKWPTANIGLALGDDLVALDLDPRNGGHLAHLEALDLEPTATATARTAGGGWHVVYQKPAGMRFVSHVPRLPGLDILTGSRYIVAAPSTVDGKRYRWERDPLDCPPARMPLHVAERLQERPTAPQDAPQAAGSGSPGQWTLQDVEAMLGVLDPWQDGYDWWIATGMAIHSEYPGADGLAAWEQWADGKPGECERKWRSFRKPGEVAGKWKSVTLGTLVYHAKAKGWNPPRPAAAEDDDAGIPEHWRITSDDWNSCPLCAALYTEEFSDGTVRTFHRWCRKKTCRVYRKVKTRRTLGPVFRWAGVRSEVVSSDDWRRWREDARQRLGDKWRGLRVGDSYLALYESPDGEDLDALLDMAAAAVLENDEARAKHRAKKKQARAFLDSLPTDTPLDPATMDKMKAALDVLATKGPGNVSTPRRRRNLADGPTPGPSPKDRPRPVRPILVSRFQHRRRIVGILDRLGIEWERQRMGGWKTGALSDGQRLALRTAFAFGVPGARPLNCAYGSTVKLDNAANAGDWPEPLPRTEREYRLDALKHRYTARTEVLISP